MVFNFGRRNRGTATTTTDPMTTTAHGNGKTANGATRSSRFGGGRTHGAYPDALNSRPTFGQWLKGVWLDLLTMVILGAIGLGVSFGLTQQK